MGTLIEELKDCLVQEALELDDKKFDEMVETMRTNAEAIKKQVARLGGFKAARVRGHIDNTVLQQLREIVQVATVLMRRAATKE